MPPSAHKGPPPRNNLGKLMHDNGITEHQIAKQCRVRQSYVNRIKNGKICPTTRTAWTLVRALNALCAPTRFTFEDVFPDPEREQSLRLVPVPTAEKCNAA